MPMHNSKNWTWLEIIDELLRLKISSAPKHRMPNPSCSQWNDSRTRGTLFHWMLVGGLRNNATMSPPAPASKILGASSGVPLWNTTAAMMIKRQAAAPISHDNTTRQREKRE